MYFWITASDGDTSIRVYSDKSELLKATTDGGYNFLKDITGFNDPDEWGGKNMSLIIKGTIVTPIAKEVIKEWDIE